MSILRYDPTTGDWVIFATSRARRPHELKQGAISAAPAASAATKACPFCPGNERLTPPEVYALRSDAVTNSSDWQVRVVPNKFPALRIEEDDRSVEESHPFFRFRGGCGAHEVIIESPNHDVFLGNQPIAQIERLLKTLQARYRDLLRDSRFKAIIIFKNHGEAAGTSLRHPHCQLIATPVVPRLVRLKQAIAAEYFDLMGRCLYAVLRDEELVDGKRVLATTDDYAAVLPYASHVPFEVWVLPRFQQASFGSVEPARLRSPAEILKSVLLKLYIGLENPDFNLMIDTVPRGDEDQEYFLWHIQILPRLTTPAGFELGSGMSINTVLPEEAAEYLRQVELPTPFAS
jgi:UDPglucose--hexose-1-phosphate uridylyltransferase